MSGVPAWYRASDMLPPYNAHVCLSFAGRSIIGARGHDKSKGSDVWAEVLGHGEMRRMKMPSLDQVLWRPQHPHLWRLLLPEPILASVVTGHTSTKVAFAATDDAELALARTSGEVARAWQDAGKGLARASEPEEIQWWRDVTRIVYQPMGQITELMTEARIMRALILDGSIRLDMRRQKTNAAALAGLKASLLDLLQDAPDDDWVPPLVPLEPDYKDYNIAMGWLAELQPTRKQVTLLRGRMIAPPKYWTQLGDEIGKTGAGAKHVFSKTIERLTWIANQPPIRSVEKLQALQERNRIHRRHA